MSDVGLGASLELDIDAALRQVSTLEARLNDATSIVLRADASLITSAIDAAVAAAVDEVSISADAADVTGEVDAAVEAADDNLTVTADASDVTGEVEGAIDAADTTAAVTGDASDVTGSIDSAVDAADTTVTPDTDASAITGEITGAVDAADTSVSVDANASAVTGAIDAAIDAADTSINIIPDPGPLRVASSAAGDLAGGLSAASAAGLDLSGVMAALGVASVTAGLYSLVTAASDLEQAVGGTEAIFGEAKAPVEAFARSAAESAGLTEEAARTLTSQLGGLLKGFGFTKSEAADLSIELSQLGADLAATFGGSTVDAVQAIGAALRGETDPIERYGISLNAAKIEARALEDGLASSKDELTANAKATAALSIITDQTADAQGQFGREVDTTAGQLERMKAEAGNAAAAVGASLQPAMNELLSTARGDLIPRLQELGESLGPALADAVIAVTPALGTLVDLLGLATPVVQVFADALDLVPGPVLAALGTFLALQRVTKPLQSGLAGLGGEAVGLGGKFKAARADGAGFGQSLGAAVGGLSALNVGLAVGTVALTLYGEEQQRIAERHAKQVAQQKEFAAALGETSTSAKGIEQALRDVVEAGEGLQFKDLGFIGQFLSEGFTAAELFRAAGVSVDQFSEAVASGGGELDRLLRVAKQNSGPAALALEDLADQMQAAARQSIIAGQAVGDFSDEQVSAAIESNRNSDGTKNYALALDQLEASAKASAEQQDALAAAVGGVDSEGATSQVTELGLRLADLRGPLEGVGGRFTAFAVAADGAGLSGSELDAVAAELGTTADRLGPVIGRVVGPINDMASAAEGAVPDLSELAGPIEGFSAEGFRDELQKSYEALVNFRDNLSILSEFSPRLAAAAAELGPAYTQTLAQALRDGNTEVLGEASLLLAGIEQEQTGLVDDVKNEFGPALVDEMGLVGAGMTDAFGNSLALVDVVNPSIRAVEGTIEQGSPLLALATGLLGANATNAFGASFTPDAGPGIAAADAQVQGAQPSWVRRLSIFGDSGDQGFIFGFNPDPRPGLAGAGAAVDGQKQSWLTKLSIFGGSGRVGFQQGIGGLSSDAGGAVDGAISSVSFRGQAAYSGGYGIGAGIGDGVIAGIRAKVAAAQAEAGAFMDAVLNAGLNAAGISSPSKVWRDEVGRPIVDGLIAGIDDGTSDVEAAAAAQVEAGLTAAQDALGDAVPVAVGGAGALTAGPGGSVIQVGSFVVNVSGPVTSQQAQQIGADVRKGFEQQVSRRRVAATARLASAR